MKKSTIIWIVVIGLIIAALIYYFGFYKPKKAASTQPAAGPTGKPVGDSDLVEVTVSSGVFGDGELVWQPVLSRA